MKFFYDTVCVCVRARACVCACVRVCVRMCVRPRVYGRAYSRACAHGDGGGRIAEHNLTCGGYPEGQLAHFHLQFSLFVEENVIKVEGYDRTANCFIHSAHRLLI